MSNEPENNANGNKPDNEADIARILSRVGPRPAPDQAMMERVRGNVHGAWQQDVKRRRLGQRLRMAAAVGAVAFSGLLASVLLPGDDQPIAYVDGKPALEYSENGQKWSTLETAEIDEGWMLRTGNSEVASVTFENGMNVRLNAGSVIRLNSDSAITLQAGQVYLDSYGNTQDSFSVITNYGTAVDIGTQFIVGLQADGWAVQVREGAVKVADGEQQVMVNSGERIAVSMDDELIRQPLPAFDASWRWAENSRPDWQLKDRTLDEYLNWVARETGRTVTFSETGLAQQAKQTRLGGILGSDVTPDDSLDDVLRTTSLKLIELTDQSIVIGGATPD